MTDQTTLAALLGEHNPQEHPTLDFLVCDCGDHDFRHETFNEHVAARLHAAGVRVTGDADCGHEAIIERLERALRVAHHKPHDQAGEPVEGFPACSVCGAIQTEVTGDAGLDVERLANATARVVGWTGALDYHREWASKVAREYAALATEEKP